MNASNKMLSLVSTYANASVDFSKPTSVRDGFDSIPFSIIVQGIGEEILRKQWVALLGRQFSAQTAKTKVGTEECKKQLEETMLQLSYGVITASELSALLNPKVTEGKAGKSVAKFSRMEVVAQARRMTKDKAALATLDVIASYTDAQYAALLIKVADKPQSLINRAIAELTKAAADKAQAELAALMADIADI